MSEIVRPSREASQIGARFGLERVRRVVVVGLGYVGLPSALCLSEAGYDVTGADVSERVVAALQAGVSPLKDLLTDDAIQAAARAGRFRATQDTTAAVREADFVIVCVPTPVDDDHKPDLAPLRAASEAIGGGLRRGTVVSFESTTFPGCTQRECVPILERESGLRAGPDFGVAYCPERLCPGDAAHTTASTPRVLGALDERSLRIARSVYESYLDAPLHVCPDIGTAECAKVLENVQRDVNIALVNEFAMMAPKLGLDAHAVLAAARTKFNFYPARPGPGVGGHCIPVDPYYLIEEARGAGFEPRMMALARRVNDRATAHVGEAIMARVHAPSRAKVAIFGLSYKGGLGDLRESPALRILEMLRPKVRLLAVHDPRADPVEAQRASQLPLLPLREAARDAHAIALVTDHPEFRGIDWRRVASLAAPGALVVDAHGVADPAAVLASGLRYWGLGRGER